MTRVRIKQSYSGPGGVPYYQAGGLYTIDDTLAADLIAAGTAVLASADNITDETELAADLAAKQDLVEKGVTGGYAPLGGDRLVPDEYLPAGFGGSGTTGATGPRGATGPTGHTGAKGVTGAKGTTGTNGTNGNVWRDGAGVPSNALGANSDYYLDDNTGDVYQKQAGAYVLVANVEGPTGAAGAAGHTGAKGTTGSKGVTGAKGVTGSKGVTGAKGATGSKGVTGAKGTTGTAGTSSAWYSGAGAPAGGLGNNSDFYLNTSNDDVYEKAGGVWSVVANLAAAISFDGTTIDQNGVGDWEVALGAIDYLRLNATGATAGQVLAATHLGTGPLGVHWTTPVANVNSDHITIGGNGGASALHLLPGSVWYSYLSATGAAAHKVLGATAAGGTGPGATALHVAWLDGATPDGTTLDYNGGGDWEVPDRALSNRKLNSTGAVGGGTGAVYYLQAGASAGAFPTWHALPQPDGTTLDYNGSGELEIADASAAGVFTVPLLASVGPATVVWGKISSGYIGTGAVTPPKVGVANATGGVTGAHYFLGTTGPATQAAWQSGFVVPSPASDGSQEGWILMVLDGVPVWAQP